jgi:hypothetical protein
MSGASTGRRGLDRVATFSAMLAVVLAAVLAGCSIRPDSAPHDVPVDKERALRSPDPETEGGAATGNDRIYLVTPGDPEQLRAVARETDGTAAGLLDVLLLGPNDDERAAGFDTSIPPDVEVNSVSVRGDVITIDVNEAIEDVSSSQLSLALGQIVFTADQLYTDGPARVVIRVDGEATTWPDATGDPHSGPLTIYDYSDLVETAQPPYPQRPPQLVAAAAATTSTTSTTAPPTTS